jgi:hypothetical protein
LRVKRSNELEEALQKLGCVVRIETAANGNGSRVR